MSYNRPSLTEWGGALIAKLGIALEEADQSLYWIELLAESKILPAEKSRDLTRQANELVAIFSASVKTARTHPGS